MKNLQFSRRRFVQLSAAGLSFAASFCTRRFTQNLACQLYTVRDVLPLAPDETLKALSAVGYREVEAQGQDLDQFKEVGSGVMDFPATLRAAQANGEQHYMVEQDYCPGDPIESLRKSFNYLDNLRL